MSQRKKNPGWKFLSQNYSGVGLLIETYCIYPFVTRPQKMITDTFQGWINVNIYNWYSLKHIHESQV